MKILKEFVKYPEFDIIEQILKENDIEIIKKSSIGIGMEYFGGGTVFDIYVDESDYEKALEIISDFKIN